jgi:hypothetical protein
MSAAEVYEAGSIKRTRRTKAEVGNIRTDIRSVLAADPPMTVRQVFYQLVIRGAIEKTEAQYQGTVIRLLTDMRMSGEIPFAWIVDESRRSRQTRTYDSVAEAVQDTAKFYRRSALRECDAYVEIWSEKEALAGIIWDVASDYDVPVMVSKGMPSLTQIHATAAAVARAAISGKETHIYQFGDHDPSGVLIPEAMRHRLNQICERLDVPAPLIRRVALTELQIAIHDLPSRPTKRDGNTHAHTFEGESTELDALPASVLRSLVRESIERHISPSQLETLRAAEESERQILEAWADKVEVAE